MPRSCPLIRGRGWSARSNSFSLPKPLNPPLSHAFSPHPSSPFFSRLLFLLKSLLSVFPFPPLDLFCCKTTPQLRRTHTHQSFLLNPPPTLFLDASMGHCDGYLLIPSESEGIPRPSPEPIPDVPLVQLRVLMLYYSVQYSLVGATSPSSRPTSHKFQNTRMFAPLSSPFPMKWLKKVLDPPSFSCPIETWNPIRGTNDLPLAFLRSLSRFYFFFPPTFHDLTSFPATAKSLPPYESPLSPAPFNPEGTPRHVGFPQIKPRQPFEHHVNDLLFLLRDLFHQCARLCRNPPWCTVGISDPVFLTSSRGCEFRQRAFSMWR